jgi:hypothetical protein
MTSSTLTKDEKHKVLKLGQEAHIGREARLYAARYSPCDAN